VNKANAPVSNRERFRAICLGKRPGDVSIVDWFNRFWVETPEEWLKQGAPKEAMTPDLFGRHFNSFNRYFQFEHHHILQEIVSEHNRTDLPDLKEGESAHVVPPILPVFERKVIEKTLAGTGSNTLVELEYPVVSWWMP